MKLNEAEREIIVRLEKEKARNIYRQIDVLQHAGFWDNVANRLYYSVFHAVSALLIFHGHSVNTHRGVVAKFGQYYIKTGILPLQYGRLYSQLQTIREKSDYNCYYDAQEEEIAPMIELAGQLIDEIDCLTKL